MDIKVLGTGCTRCKTAHELVKEAVAEIGVDAQIEHITNIKKIGKYGVLSTPAQTGTTLLVPRQLYCSGPVLFGRIVELLLYLAGTQVFLQLKREQLHLAEGNQGGFLTGLLCKLLNIFGAELQHDHVGALFPGSVLQQERLFAHSDEKFAENFNPGLLIAYFVPQHPAEVWCRSAASAVFSRAFGHLVAHKGVKNYQLVDP